MRAAEVVYEGRTIVACWKQIRQDAILVVDEEGDGGVIPANLFQRESGV